MRNAILALAVWALLYGAAEILGVMPSISLPSDADQAAPATLDRDTPDPDRDLRPRAPDVGEVEVEERDEVETTAPEEPAAPKGAVPESPDDAAFIGPPPAPPAESTPLDDDVSGPICVGGESPRLHAARLPDGSEALLVDCGRHSELAVPDVTAGRAYVVARFEHAHPLTRVEAKDLTGDGRPDLAFAFEDRMVLLPTSANGVWAAPTSLEGFTGGAAGAEREAKTEARLVLGAAEFRVEDREGIHLLVAARRGESPTILRAERAPLFYAADLR